MKLAVSQEKLEQEIGEDRQRTQLAGMIREKEDCIGESEKKIAVIESRYASLCGNIRITFILLLVVIGIFVYIALNAALIAYRFVTSTYMFVGIAVVVVGFMAYAIRRAAKEIPMYIQCKKEEKGTSQNADNYVYKIKQEKRRLQEYKAELEELKNRLNETK